MRLIAFLAAIVLASPALAHEAGPPGPNHGWFESLRVPGLPNSNYGGFSCCGVADCHVVDARAGKNGWQIAFADKWWPIPNSAVINDKGNPTGRAVACWLGATPTTILCFVAPFMS